MRLQLLLNTQPQWILPDVQPEYMNDSQIAQVSAASGADTSASTQPRCTAMLTVAVVQWSHYLRSAFVSRYILVEPGRDSAVLVASALLAPRLVFAHLLEALKLLLEPLD